MLNPAWQIFAPREPIRTLDWARDNVFTESGEPYSDLAYPHLGAPGGPMDALDCRSILAIWLQWGSRLGKTFFGQSGAMKMADREPAPLMLVSADRKLAGEVLERTVTMLERCPPLAGQVPPRHKRKGDLLRLAFCKLYLAWARSPATLADKQIRFGHGNEIDKWEHQRTSKEADPLELFLDRFKDLAGVYKVLLEGTPALKHSSRVERGRLASCNAAYYVECQRCGHYQTLRMGDGQTPGGIVWERPAGGRSDRELARKTARYVCAQCQKENHDRDRGPMMRAGVWVPEGCGVDPKKARRAAERSRQRGRPLWTGWQAADWITGTPLRDGPEYGSQLSSLYALSLTWGDIAAKFVHVHERPHLLRGFVNGWLAQTWELVKNQETWETLGQRLILREGPLAVGRGVVPEGYSQLTAGVDKQEDHFVVHVDAWQGASSHTVDYGTCEREEELLAWLGRSYGAAGGGARKIKLALIDSGNRPKGIYALCARAKRLGIALVPCKGSSTAMGVAYKKTRLGENTAAPGQPLVLVDTVTTQDWIERQLHEIPPGTPGAMSLYQAPLDLHRDYLEQLLNDAAVQDLDARNLPRESWQRIDDTLPNDLRDAKRYSYAAMLLRNRGKEPEAAPAASAPPAKKKKPKPRRRPHNSLARPGGWLSRP